MHPLQYICSRNIDHKYTAMTEDGFCIHKECYGIGFLILDENVRKAGSKKEVIWTINRKVLSGLGILLCVIAVVALSENNKNFDKYKHKKDIEISQDSDEFTTQMLTIILPDKRKVSVGKYEVTRGEFRAFIRMTGYKPSNDECYGRESNGVWSKTPLPNLAWHNTGYEQQGENYPVVCITHHDAEKFAEWASLKLDRRCYLPSESDWKVLARGGTQNMRYWWGDSIRGNDGTHEFEICDGCGPHGDKFPMPVGSTGYSNPFGLFDILGNVREWTQTCEPVTCQVAGGSWRATQTNMTVDTVVAFPRNTRSTNLGMRILCEPYVK